MTNKLKHCPFCGSSKSTFIAQIGNERTKERGATVGCVKCGIEKVVKVRNDSSCNWALETCLDAWNNRNKRIKNEL